MTHRKRRAPCVKNEFAQTDTLAHARLRIQCVGWKVRAQEVLIAFHIQP